jgi:hypothetical protein
VRLHSSGILAESSGRPDARRPSAKFRKQHAQLSAYSGQAAIPRTSADPEDRLRQGRPKAEAPSNRRAAAAVHTLGWMIDVQVMGKEGRLRRVRKIAPVPTRRAADKLEHEIRDELLRADDRVATTATRIASFRRFAEQFVSSYAVTNNKHAEVISKRKILRVHLVPAFRELRLDQIGLAEIEQYKAEKLTAKLSKKTDRPVRSRSASRPSTRSEASPEGPARLPRAGWAPC